MVILLKHLSDFFFSKINKVSLSLQEKLLVLFVTNEKIQTLKEIRTLENSYLPL